MYQEKFAQIQQETYKNVYSHTVYSNASENSNANLQRVHNYLLFMHIRAITTVQHAK